MKQLTCCTPAYITLLILFMKKNKYNSDLHSCILGNLCLPEWLPAIEANKKTLHYKKGELIFKEERPNLG